jgi:hypothetical protein
VHPWPQARCAAWDRTDRAVAALQELSGDEGEGGLQPLGGGEGCGALGPLPLRPGVQAPSPSHPSNPNNPGPFLPGAARRPRVLVCAPSNSATDELCERVLTVGGSGARKGSW